jgi:hypothetical protein
MHQLNANMGHNMPPSDLDIVKSRLADEEAGIRKSLASICDMALPDAIESEAVAGEVTERIKSLKSVKTKLTTSHKGLKAPYLECGREVDKWKNMLGLEIDALCAKAAAPLNSFLALKEEQERQRQIKAAKQEREKAEKLALEAGQCQEAGIADVAGELLDAAIERESVANRIGKNIAFARASDLAKTRSLGGSSASRKTAWVGTIVSLQGIDLEALRNYLPQETIQKALNAFIRSGGRQCGGAEIKEEITGLNIR